MDDIERPPWWLSGDEPGDPRGGDANASRNESTFEPNWMSLLGSLGSLAGQWWTASGTGDHASHGDPGEHPECLVCRAMTVISTQGPEPRVVPGVRWLPIRRL